MPDPYQMNGTETLPIWMQLIEIDNFQSVLRIRIHVFLGLPDPDPLVRAMDPDPNPARDPDPSIIMQK